MKTLKWLLAAITGIVLLVIIATLWLLFGLDPNTFKPEIERLAGSADIRLDIRGDLDWSLWPGIALQVGETELAAPRHGVNRVTWKEAQLSLDKTALLQRQVVFNAIEIAGAEIEADTVSAGVLAAPAAAGAPNTASTGQEQAINLAVKRFSLADSRITVKGEDDKITRLDIALLAAKRLNLEATPFPVSLDVALTADGQEAISLAGDIDLTLNLASETVAFATDNLQLQPKPDLPLTIALAGEFNGNADQFTLDSFSANNDALQARASLSVKNLQTAPLASGELTLTSSQLSGLATQFGLDQTLPFSDAKLEADFAASADRVAVTRLHLSLDRQTLQGKGHFQLTPTRDLEMLLNASALNLDSLVSGNDRPDGNSETALFAPMLALLALLEGGKGHIDLSLPAITGNGITVNKARLNLFANSNVIRISDISGEVFDGRVKADGRIDLRQATPQLSYTATLRGIDLPQALAVMAEPPELQGVLDLDVNGTARGGSTQALRASAKGSGSFKITDGVFKGLNAEQTLCGIAARINPKYAANKTWPAQTELETLNGNFQLNGNTLQLDSLTTGVGNIALRAKGRMQIEQQELNLLATSRLSEIQTSATGCTVSRRLVNQDIPIRCSGSLAEDSGLSCRPERDWLDGFIRHTLADELKRQIFKRREKREPAAGESAGLPSADRPEGNSISEDGDDATSEPRDLREEAVDALLRGIFGQ